MLYFQKNALKEPATVIIQAVNPNYENGTAQVTVTLMIDQAPLTVTTASAEKTYDGAPLTAPGTLEGLVNKETAMLSTTGKQTEIGSSLNTYEVLFVEDAPEHATASKENYRIAEEYLGTLSVTEPVPVYTFTRGEDTEWIRDSKTGLTLRVARAPHNEAAFEHFVGINMDGKQVAPDKFTAVSGSVILTLKAEYLDTLPLGRHTLTARFDDGAAEAHFTIAEAANPDDPKDGNDNNSGDDNQANVDDKDNGSDNKKDNVDDAKPLHEDDDDDSDGHGNIHKNSSGESNSRNHPTVKTGDEEMPVLWLLLMLTSSILLGVLLKFRKEAVKR